MSEQQLPQQLLPYESLLQVMELGEAATPATPEDFDEIATLIRDVAFSGHRPDRYADTQSVVASTPLRASGQPDTSSRISVISDPRGELASDNFAGRPMAELRISLGIKDDLQRLKGLPGSWSLSVQLTEYEGRVLTEIGGGINDGRGRADRFTYNNYHKQRASKELLEWMKGQIGDPDQLENAMSKKEIRYAEATDAVGMLSMWGARFRKRR